MGAETGPVQGQVVFNKYLLNEPMAPIPLPVGESSGQFRAHVLNYYSVTTWTRTSGGHRDGQDAAPLSRSSAQLMIRWHRCGKRHSRATG